jgi:hypothetical protein
LAETQVTGVEATQLYVDTSSKQVTVSREAIEKNDGQSGRQKQERGTGRLMSDDGMPIEHIARLVGHTSTAVTETVYRQQIRPVIVQGAEAMDRIFGP